MTFGQLYFNVKIAVLNIALIALWTVTAGISQNVAQCKSVKGFDCSVGLSLVFAVLHLASQVTALTADSHHTAANACL